MKEDLTDLQVQNFQRFIDNLRAMVTPVMMDPAITGNSDFKKIGREDFSLSNFQIFSFVQTLPMMFAAVSDGNMSFGEYMRLKTFTSENDDVHAIFVGSPGYVSAREEDIKTAHNYTFTSMAKGILDGI